ncbi:mandelate racemase/muconate lactonizing enzyme family protein [Streptomyces sioyaensis]|uniref:mandelate racemase/muconate lactonizing enzyme family protein n=1 Tax=Streptomyces sioyaensis TaxID=67364 RepID=UPI003D749832
MAPKITHIDTAAVRIVGPSLIVRIWAGEVYGIGECYPSGPVTAVDAIVTSLKEALIGEDPRNVQRLHEKMRRWHIFTGGQAGTVLTAISGLDFALWDLAGKIHGVPVYQLLGGTYRSRVRLYADCNAGTVDAAGHHRGDAELADPATPEGRAAFANAARGALDLGFTAVKFDVDDVFGALSTDEWNRTLSNTQIDRMVNQVGAIRDEVGPSFDLAIDMHARFDTSSGLRAAQALEQFNLLWLEEPVPPENIDALAYIRANTRTPICAGENLYTRYPFLELFNKSAVDCVMPDLAKFGGLTEGRRVADLAELHYVPFAPHNVSGPIGTLAAAHLCAVVSNFSVLEFHAMDVPYFEALVSRPSGPIVENGYIQLSEEPGFGVTLNEEVAFEHRHRSSEISFFDLGAPRVA